MTCCRARIEVLSVENDRSRVDRGKTVIRKQESGGEGQEARIEGLAEASWMLLPSNLSITLRYSSSDHICARTVLTEYFSHYTHVHSKIPESGTTDSKIVV
jgi:hypothetical protein